MVSMDTFTAKVPKEVEEHEDYIGWLENADGSQFQKVEAAREKIESNGVISSAKSLEDGLYEKKWNSGLRLYFAVIEKEDGKKTILLVGSGKGKEQNKAIIKAKEVLKSYKVVKENIKFNSN